MLLFPNDEFCTGLHSTGRYACSLITNKIFFTLDDEAVVIRFCFFFVFGFCPR